ncbi:response regulator [Aureimonas fodinaquatilis]|uniref:Response regulator n=1 Tax=Aureimonas fodinaquatilis TaxID=2565783 RepID=A0A5B0DYU3_9HYPH|nr:response regulator [Aureimonas fodinaquatilis]KAA0971683.1 response regulator [Aureimonas fodinaquatilis]
MKILLIEDDALIGDAVKTMLMRERHAVNWLRNGVDAADALLTDAFDLVVLDLGLPGMDGLEVLARARAAGNRVPLLALTARDSVEDRITGLNSGADDYLVKPFDMQELLARCNALARRQFGLPEIRLAIGGISLSVDTHSLEVDGVGTAISPHEFTVLQFMMERAGRVVTKGQLTDLLYGWDEGAESNTIEVYISQLRKKIGVSRIRTLRGVGYMLL